MTPHNDPFGDLEPGEYALLNGGYGGFAKYIWSLLFGGFAIFAVLTPLGMLLIGTPQAKDIVPSLVLAPIMTIIALVPWFRSGRYRLTNRRLSFKPSLRSVRTIVLSQIVSIDDVGQNKQGLRIATADARIDIRNVSNWKRLWGAILLYRIEGMDEPLPPAKNPVSHVRMRCFHQTGRGRFSQGTLVLRPTRGYFLADGSEVNAVRESVQALVRSTSTLHAKMPTFEYVQRLALAGEESFDDRLAQLADRLGATELQPGERPGLIRPTRLRKSRVTIRLGDGWNTIQGSCPAPMAHAAESWLSDWRTAPM